MRIEWVILLSVATGCGPSHRPHLPKTEAISPATTEIVEESDWINEPLPICIDKDETHAGRVTVEYRNADGTPRPDRNIQVSFTDEAFVECESFDVLTNYAGIAQFDHLPPTSYVFDAADANGRVVVTMQSGTRHSVTLQAKPTPFRPRRGSETCKHPGTLSGIVLTREGSPFHKQEVLVATHDGDFILAEANPRFHIDCLSEGRHDISLQNDRYQAHVVRAFVIANHTTDVIVRVK